MYTYTPKDTDCKSFVYPTCSGHTVTFIGALFKYIDSLSTALTAPQNKIKNCGLNISQKFPMIAALPDGITEKNTFEIKCPTTDNISIKKENKEGKIT